MSGINQAAGLVVSLLEGIGMQPPDQARLCASLAGSILGHVEPDDRKAVRELLIRQLDASAEDSATMLQARMREREAQWPS